MNLLKEAKRLHDMGFAIIWCHPKSKRPVESGWTTGERKPWSYLKETYFEGLNMGVRLGEPSKIGNGYLTAVDVDVKSKDPKHRAEAIAAAKALLGEATPPMVRSGRGGGSRHYYCLTSQPFKTWNPAHSEEMVKVVMPSKRPSKRELSDLTADEIGKGIRLSRAWEVSIYNSGRQTVLPGSVHPDSGEMYTWVKPLTLVKALPLVTFPDAPEGQVGEAQETSTKKFDTTGFDFKAVKVDIEWLPITDELKEGIKHGTNVTDRSGYLLRASSALLAAGLEENEVLSVLTDPRHVLSSCAYEHAKTKDRNRAAYWIFKYTLARVASERKAENIFTSPPLDLPKISKKEQREQREDLMVSYDWRKQIIRSGQHGDGPPKSCVINVVTIFENAISEKLFKRNLFSYRDTYGDTAPWESKREGIITDDDVIQMKYWLSRSYGFEPKNQVIEDAIAIIAQKNAFDPVKDSLEALPAWDGKSRLDTWLMNYFSAKGSASYNAEVFRKWIVAMILRVYEPGAKFDWMPIFEGGQGIGKSSFGKILAGGDKYFLDNLPNLHDKDAALILQGVWTVEMSELASLRKNEIEIIKAFTSRTTDKVRPPYGRRVIESERRCVFFGTTNKEQYLIDETGNRRFKPLLVGELNFEALRRDRDQLFAEAKHLYDNKIETVFTLGQLSEAALLYEKTIHSKKTIEDDSSLMLEAISDAFSSPEKSKFFSKEKLRIYDLFGATIPQGVPPLFSWKKDRRNEMAAAKALKKLGWIKWESSGRSFWKAPKTTKMVEKVPTATEVPPSRFSEVEMNF